MKNLRLLSKIIFVLIIVGFMFSCSDPLETVIEKQTLVKDGTIEFCNYEVVNTWCWDDNMNTWFDVDLSSYTNGQAVVEITLDFIDSDDPGIDSANIYVRKDEFSQEKYISSNHISESVVLLTDENGHVEWKHDCNVDVSRKINIAIRLTMIQK